MTEDERYELWRREAVRKERIRSALWSLLFLVASQVVLYAWLTTPWLWGVLAATLLVALVRGAWWIWVEDGLVDEPRDRV